MTTITLTPNQWQQIVNDANGSQLLSNEEIEAIARKLQQNRNLPFINEEKEYIVFVKIVRSLDQVLYENLPNEIYSTIWDSDTGIERHEKNRLVKSLTKFINSKIDIPYLPETAEKHLIKGFLHLIVNALLKGNSLRDLLTKEIPE